MARESLLFSFPLVLKPGANTGVLNKRAEVYEDEEHNHDSIGSSVGIGDGRTGGGADAPRCRKG